MTETNQYHVVRSVNAGVFFGKIIERPTNNSVVMDDARRIWYWEGAASLSELSVNGVKHPDKCKFPVAVNGVEILDVCEILRLTDEAYKSLSSVNIWTA